MIRFIVVLALVAISAEKISMQPIEVQSSISTDQDGVLSQFTLLNRPYPSVSTLSNELWDIFMVMDTEIANNNFENMYAAPETYEMLRSLYYKDCVTPVQDWYYPEGTCFIVNVTLSAPVLELDVSSNTLNLVMNATGGDCVLNETGGNYTINLEGAQFFFDVDLSQIKITTANSTMVFVNTTGASCSVQSTNITNPNFAASINAEMASAFQNASTTDTYPFMTYNQTVSKDEDAFLVPTYFEVDTFMTEYGDTYVAFFIMTEGRDPPSSRYLDTGLLYIPDGSNVFMLVSNNLLTNRAIPNSLSSNYTYEVATKSIEQLNSTTYSTVEGSFNTGISFEANSDAKQEFGNCEITKTTDYNVILETFTVSSISSQASSNIILQGLSQDFTFAYCTSEGSGGGSTPNFENCELSYQLTISYYADGGYVKSNSSVENFSTFPTSESELEKIITENTGPDPDEIVKTSQTEVGSSLDISIFNSVFNIFADEQVLFGPVKGFDVTGVAFVYDMFLFGKVVV